MTGHFKLQIPSKPYLIKFISGKYGYPVKISNQNLLGIVVLALLQKKLSLHYDISQRHIAFRAFTSVLTCYVPFKEMNQFGFDINDDRVIQLNRLFDDAFEEELYEHVARNVKQDGRYKGYDAALENFCEKFGLILDEDITFEGLKKCEYRIRKLREKNLTNSVPSLSRAKLNEAASLKFEEKKNTNSVLSQISIFDLLDKGENK